MATASSHQQQTDTNLDRQAQVLQRTTMARSLAHRCTCCGHCPLWFDSKTATIHASSMLKHTQATYIATTAYADA
jgi:hypothetical protein